MESSDVVIASVSCSIFVGSFRGPLSLFLTRCAAFWLRCCFMGTDSGVSSILRVQYAYLPLILTHQGFHRWPAYLVPRAAHFFLFHWMVALEVCMDSNDGHFGLVM
jgi:hypothetical protein